MKATKRARTLLLIGILGLSACAPSSEPTAASSPGSDEAWLAKLDESVAAHMELHKIPGVALAFSKDGEVVYSKGYGLASVELDVPASEESVFEIGSISKQFTAVGIMMLVADGKLSLDDPIEQHVEGLPGEWHGIPIRALLTHTSGIPDYEEIMGYDRYREEFEPAEVFEIAASKPLDFPTGSEYRYSNTGYFILTLILEQASGQVFEEFLAERIWQPLGMTATRNSEPKDIILNRASGYAVFDDVLQNRDPIQPSSTGGAGTIVSTVGDLLIWEKALQAGEVLPLETLELMWSPTTLADGSESNYGFGWITRTYRGHPEISHSGQTAGYVTTLNRFPDLGLSIAILGNKYQSGLRDLAVDVLAHYDPEVDYNTLEPATDQAAGDPEGALQAIREMSGREAAFSQISEPLQGYVQAEDFAGGRETIGGWLDTMENFEFLKTWAPEEPRVSDLGEDLAEFRLYRFKMTDDQRYWILWYDSEGMVIEFGIVRR